jgi:site-specific DNA recombinase
MEQIRGIGNDPALVRETVRQVNQQQAESPIYEADVEKALAAFDPLWDTLTNREQARAVELLLKEVTYDVRSGKVVITFHPSWIQSLANQEEVGA